jgi:hypothetical protein
VTGKIYDVDGTYTGGHDSDVTCHMSGPGANKTLVDNAILAIGTAYTDAANRALPNGTELYGGNLGGRVFAPGLYKWSTNVTIPTDVTLSGGAMKVKLIGGALAKNVFWQVTGSNFGATLGTYSTFNGTILSAKQVILQTGATLNGRALAQTQVTLDANTVSLP